MIALSRPPEVRAVLEQYRAATCARRRDTLTSYLMTVSRRDLVTLVLALTDPKPRAPRTLPAPLPITLNPDAPWTVEDVERHRQILLAADTPRRRRASDPHPPTDITPSGAVHPDPDDLDPVIVERLTAGHPVAHTRAERDAAVHALTGAGTSAADIAHLLGVTERTVVRIRRRAPQTAVATDRVNAGFASFTAKSGSRLTSPGDEPGTARAGGHGNTLQQEAV